MALDVHAAGRATAFVRPLAELLAGPVADPLATEVVGIPMCGLECWLSQQLAQALGAAPTRTRTSLIVVGDEDSIRDAIRRPIARASGLRERLWGPRQPDPLSGSVQA